MMLAHRTCNLLKICPRLRRALHPASVVCGKVSGCHVSKQDVLLSQQLRSLSSKPDDDSGDVDISSVFRSIQKSVGIKQAVPEESTSSPAPDEPHPDELSPQDEQALRDAIMEVAVDWRELYNLLGDGQEMSGVALAMFVEENIASCPYMVLCKLMSSYGEILDKDSRQFTLMLDEGMRRMSEESLLQALLYMQALQKIPEDKVQSKYFELSLEKIKHKIMASNTPMELVFALSVLRKNQVPEFMLLLDSKITQLLPEMTLENIVDLLHVKAIDRQRNPVLIKSILDKLKDISFEELTLQQAMNLFYSCSTLSIYNQLLLSKLSKHTTELLSNKKPNRETWQCTHSILFSCKHLHWKDEKLVQECVNQSHCLLPFKPLDLMADIITMCHLGYKPADFVKVLENSGQAMELRVKKPFLWLQYVHATAFHQLAPVGTVKAALDPEFYTPLLNQDKGYNVKTMLLNLQGCLALDMKRKIEPLENEDQFIQDIKVMRGKNSIAHPIEAAFKYISTNVSGPRVNKYGHRIDFDVEFRLDSTEMGRAVVRVLEFNEMVQAESGTWLTGPSSMAVRHLKAEDTPVLVIPYYRWKMEEVGAVNAARLETMLREAYNAHHKIDFQKDGNKDAKKDGTEDVKKDSNKDDAQENKTPVVESASA